MQIHRNKARSISSQSEFFFSDRQKESRMNRIHETDVSFPMSLSGILRINGNMSKKMLSLHRMN